MKKTLLNSIALFFIAGSAVAQPVIIASGITPVVGDKFTLNYTNYLSPGPGGANQSWNFAALNSTSAVNYTTGTVASSPYASSFPNANLQLNNGSEYLYFNTSASALKIAGNHANGVTMAYSDQEDMIRFPFAFNDTYTDPYAVTFVNTSLTFTRTGSVTATYDGYGTVTTPAGVFTNAARVHWVETYSDASSFGTISYTNDEYMWYVNGQHQPVLALTSLTSTSSFTSFTTQSGVYAAFSGGTATGLAEIFADASDISAFPNPATETTQLEVKGDRIYSLELFDLNGKLLISETIAEGNPAVMDVRSLSPGMYVARVTTVNGRLELKKISVQK